jgi:agmatinase
MTEPEGATQPHQNIVGPADARVVPRFAGATTFARLPAINEVDHADVAVVGVPFDGGVTYRPGARFGPQALRAGSRLLRAYHQRLDVYPFHTQQVVDAGDIACNPFSIDEAIQQIDEFATTIIDRGTRIIALGGDHTIALPLLRATHRKHGPVALVHFDAHLDTWDTYFGANYTHGTPFRRAAEEQLIVPGASLHVGIRGPIFGREDLTSDEALGFGIIPTEAIDELGVPAIAAFISERVGNHPVYISIDIDVLDPANAPGTGTPEAGGLTSRELLSILRRLTTINIVGGDLVEVAPAYDHAEITAIAGAHMVYELLGLLALQSAPPRD